MDHRALGQHFGYPECCIEAFVADRDKDHDGFIFSAQERGVIILGPNRCYVPCPACVGKLGYMTFEELKRESQRLFE